MSAKLSKMIFTRKAVLQTLAKDETGLAALETAIILIAFIVVASVFAFTMLSAGTFSTERGKEAVYAGLAAVQSSMELRGSVIITSTTTGTAGTVDNVIFTVANTVGGEPVDLTAGSGRKLVVDYLDSTQRTTDLNWALNWIVRTDSDDQLEEGELAEISVPLSALANTLGVNTDFTLEIKPPKGAVLNLQRTTPAYMELVADLQ